MDCRPIVLGLCALGCSADIQAATRPQRRAIPPAAEEAPAERIACQLRHVSRGFGALEAVHIARRGELIAPPGDYSRGLSPLDPRAAASSEGTIYDAALLAVDAGEMVFELRTYDGGDLTHPRTSRFLSFPIGERVVQLRHLRLAIAAATASAITYRIAFAPMLPVAPSRRTDVEESVSNECRRDMQDVDVARPQP